MFKKIILSCSALLLFLCIAPANAQSNKSPKTKNSEKAPACHVSEFRETALATHDTQTRGEMAVVWMKTNGASCSLEKLVSIKNNRAAWLGTSDSIKLMSLIDGAIELKTDRNPELLAQLYSPNGKVVTASAEAQPTAPGEAKPANSGEKASKPVTP